MYDQQILNEIEDINQNILDIGNYLNTIDLHIANCDAALQEIVSGDILIQEQIQTTNNNMIMIASILTLTLLFTFIMRCFK